MLIPTYLGHPQVCLVDVEAPRLLVARFDQKHRPRLLTLRDESKSLRLHPQWLGPPPLLLTGLRQPEDWSQASVRETHPAACPLNPAWLDCPAEETRPRDR